MADKPAYVQRAIDEDVDIIPYDPDWPRRFEEEKRHLLECLPNDLIGRIEHFGSTAVPGLSAKPIVDMLVEVTSLEVVRDVIAPILKGQGYEFFWRPTAIGNTDLGYTWFIKRDAQGRRTHHIHMLEKHSHYWERLQFRDYLIEHPEVAGEYEALKRHAAQEHGKDRKAYAKAKSEYIDRIAVIAKRYYAERSRK